MNSVSNLKTIDALILCGGLGTRLRSKIGDSQKVMTAMDDRPFLDILLDDIFSQGLKRVVLCTGYQADTIEQYYRSKDFKISIEFSREKEPLGTGGAVENAKGFVKSNPFLVFNGDSFCKIDFRKLLEFHATSKARASIVISKVSDHRDFGSITIDAFQKITGFKEKTNESSRGYANCGIYCFNRDIFNLMPQEKKFSIEHDFFPKLVSLKFYGFVTESNFIDIGTPKRYEKAKQFFRKAK